MTENTRNSVNGAVEHGRTFGGIIAEKKVATSPAASTCLQQVGRIAMRMEHHVAGATSDGRIRMGRATIEKACDSVGSVFGALRLFSCDGAKSNTEGVVNGAGVKQKFANDALNAFDALGG